MFLIFGFRTKATALGWVQEACRVCGQFGSLLLVREVTKFSLFFIPLIPVRSKHVLRCQNAFCHNETKISGEEARRLQPALR
ncbi:zinc-ribbon domain-containing protein [Catenuloplanes sp. NPDC051500]|uniref:zinc-ribbon domain-containing protein n=1 Tax=Catenuloplanes sp. NPDC051500 TaxID=3363959 RepID=UPI0037A1B60C